MTALIAKSVLDGVAYFNTRATKLISYSAANRRLKTENEDYIIVTQPEQIRGLVFDAVLFTEQAHLNPKFAELSTAIRVRLCTGPFSSAFDCPVHDPRKKERV